MFLDCCVTLHLAASCDERALKLTHGAAASRGEWALKLTHGAPASRGEWALKLAHGVLLVRIMFLPDLNGL